MSLSLSVFIWRPSTMNVIGEYVNMEKIGHPYVTQYFYLSICSPTNIKVYLNFILGKSAPLFIKIKYWM